MLRSTTARKILAATIPTKPAAIHSIVSMKRSMAMRFMRAPTAKFGSSGGGSCRRRRFADRACVSRWRGAVRLLLRQRVVFGEVGAQLLHRRVGVDAGLLHAIGPALGQRLRRLLPFRELSVGELVDFVARLRLDLVDAGIL